MKTRNFQKPLLAAIAGLALLAGNILAQDSTAANPTAAAVQSAPQLSYGVPQVLQLSQAKVSDGTIVTYIQNSGTIYALDANQIVYLKQQGVSDTVLNTMLNQRQNVANSAAQTAPPPASAQTPNAVAQPTVTYSTVPSSSVYVIPDTQTYRYDAYYYQPYSYPYYGYYGWSYPAVSLSFGFGGRWGGGHGGWHR
jgi:hypothetical protein